MLLAGDIGGTKTILSVYSRETGLHTPLAEATFPSRDFASLEALVQEFLSRTGLPAQHAVLGVAGPVVQGRAAVTNLPWSISEEPLRSTLGLRSVHLLNDLEAIGSAVPLLGQADLHTLYQGKPNPHAPIAIIAPGTGLGEAFLVWDGNRYRTLASEGGHTSFSPIDDVQVELLRYLQQRLGHVSYERVCSGGLGIPNIYHFLKDRGYAQEPGWLAEQLATTSDPTPLIFRAATDETQSCSICKMTLDMFVTILGSAAGNLALTVLATGGVFLGGGIPPRILPLLKGDRFLKAFRGKGRLSELLVDAPLHVILNPKAALLGAASYGLSLL